MNNMNESTISDHSKQFYLNNFGLALSLLLTDRLTTELIDMGYSKFILSLVREHMKQDYEYLKLISK